MPAGEPWPVAPPDRYSRWFEQGDRQGLDRWIRSPAAPPEGRGAALEQWLLARPNGAVLRQAHDGGGKYSPVAEYLRARLEDPLFRTAPYSARVWLALARSGWLGERGDEKHLRAYASRADLSREVIPELGALAAGYGAAARAYVCDLLHARAAASADADTRIALYGAIQQLTTVP